MSALTLKECIAARHSQGGYTLSNGSCRVQPFCMLQAFILYEEAIPDSKAEVTALQSIVGVLHRCRVFTAESRDTLVHKATGYSAKLLKKPDQCRAVCACSHLFWQELPAEASPITLCTLIAFCFGHASAWIFAEDRGTTSPAWKHFGPFANFQAVLQPLQCGDMCACHCWQKVCAFVGWCVTIRGYMQSFLCPFQAFLAGALLHHGAHSTLSGGCSGCVSGLWCMHPRASWSSA